MRSVCSMLQLKQRELGGHRQKFVQPATFPLVYRPLPDVPVVEVRRVRLELHSGIMDRALETSGCSGFHANAIARLSGL